MPALCLFFAAVKKVCEAAGDIIHFSLLGGNIAVTVNVKGSQHLKRTHIFLLPTIGFVKPTAVN